MEQVDAEQHGWIQAPYPTKADTDASYKRLLDSCLREEWAGAIRLGVASHNLFDVAWALTLRDELPESRRGDVEIEMLEGMVPAQTRAVQRAGRDDAAVLPDRPRRGDRGEPRLPRPPLRREHRAGELPAGDVHDAAGLARVHRSGRPLPRCGAPTVTPSRPGGSANRSTSPRRAETGAFANQPDTDLHRPRAASRHHHRPRQVRRQRKSRRRLPADDRRRHRRPDRCHRRRCLAGLVGPTAASSGRRCCARRRRGSEAERWTTLAQMAAEAAKTIREGDPEVSEAIDFARYYSTATVPSATAPVRRGRRGLAVELPVRDPGRRRPRRADGRQHGDPQAAAGDPSDRLVARQPVLARRHPDRRAAVRRLS